MLFLVQVAIVSSLRKTLLNFIFFFIVTHIEVSDKLAVTAFGQPIPHLKPMYVLHQQHILHLQVVFFIYCGYIFNIDQISLQMGEIYLQQCSNSIITHSAQMSNKISTRSVFVVFIVVFLILSGDFIVWLIIVKWYHVIFWVFLQAI